MKYTISWWYQHVESVRLSWWRRLLRQERTFSVWHHPRCTVSLTKRQLKAHGGWMGLTDTLITPLVCARGPIVGLQVEDVVETTSYVRTNG